MMLKPESEKVLDAWLGPSTWHTSHPNDMNRWYDFVNQYQRDHGYGIDEEELRELIESKLGGNVGEPLQNEIRERISLAYNILDFLKNTGR